MLRWKGWKIKFEDNAIENKDFLCLDIKKIIMLGNKQQSHSHILRFHHQLYKINIIIITSTYCL